MNTTETTIRPVKPLHEWTEPYHGLTHYGNMRDLRRVSVQQFENGRAQLLKWFPGCGFSPVDEMYATVEKAKAAGMAWVQAATA